MKSRAEESEIDVYKRQAYLLTGIHRLERVMNPPCFRRGKVQGASMREYELEVLEQYDIEVISTRKTRGAYFCNTKEMCIRDR